MLSDVSDLALPRDSSFIRMLQCPEYRLDSSDNDDDWRRAPYELMPVLHTELPSVVSAVQCAPDATSQADISRSFASAGKFVPARNLRVQDAQGATMQKSAWWTSLWRAQTVDQLPFVKDASLQMLHNL